MRKLCIITFIFLLQCPYATASKGLNQAKLKRIVEEAFIGETNQIRARARVQLRQADILAIPALRTALKSPNPSVRKGAAKWLARHGAKAASALPDLLISIKDMNAQVRSFSAKALAKIGNKALPGLLALVKHKQAYVREQAIVAISQFRVHKKTSVQALIDSLKDKDNMVRWAAIKSLSKINPFLLDTSSIIQRVGDNEPYIRREAIKILKRYGVKVAKTLVLYVGDSNSNIREYARRRLDELGEKIIPFILPSLANKRTQVRVYVRTTIKSYGESSYKILINNLKHQNLARRREAGKLLSNLGKKVVPFLIKALRHHSSLIRWHTTMILGKMGSSSNSAIPHLRKSLKDKDKAVRWSAFLALRELGVKTLPPI